MSRSRLILTLLGIAALGGVVFGLSGVMTAKPGGEARPAPPPVPVTAAKAEAADVPIILRGLGNVTAFNTVALRSRVEGAITQINFRKVNSFTLAIS